MNKELQLPTLWLFQSTDWLFYESCFSMLCMISFILDNKKYTVGNIDRESIRIRRSVVLRNSRMAVIMLICLQQIKKVLLAP